MKQYLLNDHEMSISGNIVRLRKSAGMTQSYTARS